MKVFTTPLIERPTKTIEIKELHFVNPDIF